MSEHDKSSVASYRLAVITRELEEVYAEVMVEASIRAPDEAPVSLSDSVFAWLKTEYGPDAWEWSVCREYRDAAIEGVRYALASSASERLADDTSIKIIEIQAHPAHSTCSGVSEAACQATWKALGVPPRKSPFLNRRDTQTREGGGEE